MRISIELASENKTIFLPFNYHEYLQAIIYNSLKPEHAEKLHNEGFLHGKRHFRLFTFSRLIGKRDRQRSQKTTEGLVFIAPLRWQISSPIDWVLQEIVDQFLRSGRIAVGSQQLIVKSISVQQPPQWDLPLRIRMLSPMTIYSTFTKPDGRKITHYYAPQEQDFSLLMSSNLCKKYQIIYKQSIDESINIMPLSARNRERIIKYKGTIIKAWDGLYQLDGNPELIRVAYECGLGAKNSQGFGMWEVINT